MHTTLHKVIIADDSEQDCQDLIRVLDQSKLRFSVTTVSDGPQLMKLLLAPDAELPYLLFLDLKMPGMTGFDCLQQIRAVFSLKELVVVIFSGTTSQSDIEKTFRDGANVFLNKSGDFSKIKDAIENMILYRHLYEDPPFNIANFVLNT